MLRAISMIQMSRLSGPPVLSATATRRSSGESARLKYGAASPTVPRARPVRSNHVNCVAPLTRHGVHQRAILRNGRAHVAASLRADVLGQRKRIALQLTRVRIERLRHQVPSRANNRWPEAYDADDSA